jgi:two-component system sensor histidine kinase UhpB
VRALFEGKTVIDELLDIEDSDGRRKVVQNSAAPIRDTAGHIVGAVIVNADVTERVQAEAALQESADRLQQLSRRLLAVQEEERRHLSRELHDEFGQLLATISLHLHAAKALAGTSAHDSLQQALTLLQRAGAEVRDLALELRPTMLETAGVDATLRWLAQQHQQLTGIETNVIGHLGELSGECAIACFRIVQEALTNVVRHAGAQHVWISLSESEDLVELNIRDDGVGFDAARILKTPLHQRHLGLDGMRERVEILGGTLHVESQPGHGTCVAVSLPLSEQVGAAATEPTEPTEHTA